MNDRINTFLFPKITMDEIKEMRKNNKTKVALKIGQLNNKKRNFREKYNMQRTRKGK